MTKYKNLSVILKTWCGPEKLEDTLIKLRKFLFEKEKIAVRLCDLS